MENLVGCILVAAIAFPVSFFMARGCLRSFIRIVTGPGKRNVL
jgi:hypothetical protein